MFNLLMLSYAGGLFALLTLVHFVVDWGFQTHRDAMLKHSNWGIRAGHCFIYTVGFIPLLCFFDYNLIKWVMALNILFWSHFVLDTYILVFLWARYIRKVPEMLSGSPQEGFKVFAETPLGKILAITIDQLSHLICLLPLVYMALN